MTDEQARAVILDALADIAPEIDPDTVDPDAELGTALDLDSMDFLNLVQAVAAATGRAIPERDYPKIATLAGFAAYLSDAAP